MLIRSQDRDRIVNLNNIAMIHVSDDGDVLYETDDSCEPLGHYSSKKKAVKVLDMIVGKYESANYEVQKSSTAGIDTHTHGYGFGYVKNVVFNLPADGEVTE